MIFKFRDRICNLLQQADDMALLAVGLLVAMVFWMLSLLIVYCIR